MVSQRKVRAVFNFGILVLVGTGIGLAGVEPTYANCGGKCQAGKMCGSMVGKKEIKDQSQRHDEYLKCMRDPNTYK